MCVCRPQPGAKCSHRNAISLPRCRSQVRGTTTHFIGALIGKSFNLNNSAWPGYSGNTSRCVVDAFCHELDWCGAVRPGLIVRTVADGHRYIFEPFQILPSFGRKARTLADKELAILKLRAPVEAESCGSRLP